jgi:WD40 repeat protein
MLALRMVNYGLPASTLNRERSQVLADTGSASDFWLKCFVASVVSVLFPILPSFSQVPTRRDEPRHNPRPYLVVGEGHGGRVNRAVFSHDGNYVLTGSSDKSARLWGTDSGTELHVFGGHEDSVTTVTFSPDDRFIATGAADEKEGTVRLWELKSGKQVGRFRTTPVIINALSFSPNGRTILALSYQPQREDAGAVKKPTSTLRIWDVRTGKILHDTRIPTFVRSAVWSPDGKYVLTGGRGLGSTAVWDVFSGKVVRELAMETESVDAAAFSADGHLAATGDAAGLVSIWDLATGEKRADLHHRAGVLSVAFSPDGKYVYTASHDAEVTKWEVGTFTKMSVVQTANSRMRDVQFSPDRSAFIIVDESATVSMWDFDRGQQTRRLASQTLRDSSSVSFTPDDRFILVGDERSAVIWDIQKGIVVTSDYLGNSGLFQRTSSGAVSADGRFAATAGADSLIRLWDVVSGQEIRRFKSIPRDSVTLVFVPNGCCILTDGDENTLRLIDISTGQEAAHFGHRGSVRAVAFSSDGHSLLTADSNWTVRLWNATQSQQDAEIKIDRLDDVRLAVLCPERAVVIAGNKKDKGQGKGLEIEVQVWNGARKEKLSEFRIHQEDVFGSYDLSQDGRFLITFAPENSNSVVTVWDAQTGSKIREINLPNYTVNFGKILFCKTNDCFVVVGRLEGDPPAVDKWDIATGKKVSQIGNMPSISTASIAIAIPNKADFALLGMPDKAPQIWSFGAGQKKLVLGNDEYFVFSPDHHVYWTHYEEKNLELWENPARKYTDLNLGDVRVFSPDGRRLYSGGCTFASKFDICAYDSETSKGLSRLEGHVNTITSLTPSADGHLLLSGSADSSAIVWDTGKNAIIRRLTGHSRAIASSDLSPDGRIALTGSDDGTARTWDVNSGKEIWRIDGRGGRVRAVALSHDARFALTGNEDGSTQLWDLASGSELCLLATFRDGRWLVVSPDGHFDASDLDTLGGAHWWFAGDPEPLGFTRLIDGYYVPHLLSRIVLGEKFYGEPIISPLHRSLVK